MTIEHVGTRSLDLLVDLRSHGTATALVSEHGELTYVQLADRVDEFAARWAGPRRLVLLQGRNEVETVVAYLAALTAGHPIIFTPPRADGRLLAEYNPDITVNVDSNGLHLDIRREESVHDLHPDLALLMSTSGSTGSPKLVRLSAENIASNAASIAEYLALTSHDRAITSLPLHYCYGLSVLNSHLAVGASTTLTNLSVVDDCFWTLAERAHVTGLAGVPHTFDLLDSSGFDQRLLPSLRYLTQAGGKLAPQRVQTYADAGQARGWDFFVMYGQTEATARMAYLPPDLAYEYPHAIGQAIPGGSLRIDEPTDGVGELVYSGPNVMMGYASTANDLSAGHDVDELFTGDLAREVADGIFEVVGRRSRFAKVFGLRINLDEIESHLAENGLTAHCTEVDGSLGVVTTCDASQVIPAITQFCHIPPWVIHVASTRAVPVSDNGKIDRIACECLIVDAIAKAPSVPSNPAAHVEALVGLYAGVLGRTDVTPDSSFVGLGADSLSYVELSVRLGERLDPLPSDWQHRTIRDLAGTAHEPGAWASTDTSIVIRAAAIVAVVGTHANVFTVVGGAHILLALAGFNVARFLPRTGSATRHLGRGLRSVAVPSALWIGAICLLTGMYRPATALFANGFVGSDRWNVQWQFWFLEAWVWTVAGIAFVLAVPAVRRLERRAPFGFALAFVAGAAALRFALVGVEAGPTERYTGTAVLWAFALGWAAARSRTTWQRVVVSAATVALTVGFFGDLAREGFIIGGILLVLWVPHLRLPRLVSRVASSLAAASLAIYLTHWQVYPHLEDNYPLLALLSSLLVGLAYFWLSEQVTSRLKSLRGRPTH